MMPAKARSKKVAGTAAPIPFDDPGYPESLRELRRSAPPQIQAVGNDSLLGRPGLAFLCSIQCPGDVILMAYDVARVLRDAGISVIGGFHSPMEQECLDLLLRGTQPVIVALARSVGGMRLPARWRSAIDAERLLVLSFCAQSVKRPTAESADFRNRCVAAIAEQVLVAHASQGGKVDALTRELLAGGRRVLTFRCSANAHLVELGACPVDATNLVSSLS